MELSDDEIDYINSYNENEDKIYSWILGLIIFSCLAGGIILFIIATYGTS